MNWAGNWSVSVTYFKNDVAFDTTANNSYVMITASLTGGSRPGLNNTNWKVLAPGGGTGVTSVTGTANQIGVTAGPTPVVSLAAPSPAPTPGAYTNANITVDGLGRVTAAASGSGASANPGVISSALGANVTITTTAPTPVLLTGFTTTVANANVAIFYNVTFINQSTTKNYTLSFSPTTLVGTATLLPSVLFQPYFHVPCNPTVIGGITQTTITCSGTLLFACGAAGQQQIRFDVSSVTAPDSNTLTVAGTSGADSQTICQAYGPVGP
jgi:hypothetical protein